MKTVLILGAHGKIAQLVIKELTAEDVNLKLFLRNSARLSSLSTNKRVQLFEGNAANLQDLVAAMENVDIVYANLAGNDIEEQAKNVVTSMNQRGLKRLIWISTLGIYDEVPGAFGKWNHEMLDGGYLETYAAAAKVIEASDLEYTIIRPAWLTNKDEVDFEKTQKGETFRGTEVSRKSVASFVVDLINNSEKELRHSVGLNKPNSDAPKPSWY